MHTNQRNKNPHLYLYLELLKGHLYLLAFPSVSRPLLLGPRGVPGPGLFFRSAGQVGEQVYDSHSNVQQVGPRTPCAQAWPGMQGPIFVRYISGPVGWAICSPGAWQGALGLLVGPARVRETLGPILSWGWTLLGSESGPSFPCPLAQL